MTPYYDDGQAALYLGDAIEVLREMPAASVNMCVTSPPYWGLRDYGVDGQIGLEPTPETYVERLVDVFREVKRVLRDDGTLFLNLGDSYAAERGGTHQPAETLAGGRHGKTVNGERVNRGRGDNYNPARNARALGLKHKDLVGIPWMVAFALRADGWWLRQDIIWSKPNPMPESVTDRCTKAHKYLFLLSKRERYYYDQDAIREVGAGWNGSKFDDGKNAEIHPNVGRKRRTVRPGIDTHGGGQGKGYIEYPEGTRNRRSVWHIPSAPFPEAHFATFPPALVEPCILAGCPEGGTVLDPFVGSGTVAMVAKGLGRRAIGIDLNPEYLAMAVRRIPQLAMIGVTP